MEPAVVLIANLVLDGRTGTELYTRDLALELRRRGYRPVVFSPRLGPLASEIEQGGVAVVDSLARLTEPPAVIQGHHLLETAAAVLAFPEAAALFVCHDAAAWHSEPPALGPLRTFAAVDEACADRLRAHPATAGAAVHVVPNAVDLGRFRPRGPLPAAPRRALLFSNYARPGARLSVFRAACVERHIDLDLLGEGVGAGADRPEDLLGQYDLVFARARCALEAMAVGCAVVVCDLDRLAGLVTPVRVDAWRPLNFGRRCLTEPVDAGLLGAAIDAYDAAAASAVSARIRTEAGLPAMVDRLVELYDAARAARPVAGSPLTARGLAFQLGPIGGLAIESGRLADQLAESELARRVLAARVQDVELESVQRAEAFRQVERWARDLEAEVGRGQAECAALRARLAEWEVGKMSAGAGNCESQLGDSAPAAADATVEDP